MKIYGIRHFIDDFYSRKSIILYEVALVLSGYFTPGSYDWKGPKNFLKERFIRL